MNWSCKLTLWQRERDGGGGQPPVKSQVRAQSNTVGRLRFFCATLLLPLFGFWAFQVYWGNSGLLRTQACYLKCLHFWWYMRSLFPWDLFSSYSRNEMKAEGKGGVLSVRTAGQDNCGVRCCYEPRLPVPLCWVLSKQGAPPMKEVPFSWDEWGWETETSQEINSCWVRE